MSQSFRNRNNIIYFNIDGTPEETAVLLITHCCRVNLLVNLMQRLSIADEAQRYAWGWICTKWVCIACMHTFNELSLHDMSTYVASAHKWHWCKASSLCHTVCRAIPNTCTIESITSEFPKRSSILFHCFTSSAQNVALTILINHKIHTIFVCYNHH